MERYGIRPEAAVYYVTYSVVEWLPVFITEATFSIVTKSLTFCHEQKHLRINAFVVMPTHMHMIVLDANFDNERLVRTLADFRKFTGRQLSDYCGCHFPRCFGETLREQATGDRERRFWQPSRQERGDPSEARCLALSVGRTTTMRRIRFAVAASLDGFIAGPNGEFDWIIMDPEIDFDAIYKEYDTVLMGRRSFETSGGGAWGYGMKTLVISRTLRQQDHPGVTIVGDNVKQSLTALRKQPGKDIWLFGGGLLFRSLLELGLVDTVEVALIPVLLGDGIPLLPPPLRQARLKLTSHKIYRSGIVGLEYSVQRAASVDAKRKTKRAAGKKKSGRSGRRSQRAR